MTAVLSRIAPVPLLAFVFASGAVTLSSPSYAERDPFIATWGGQCSDQVQCWIDIEPAGKDYKVQFRAANKLDANKFVCKIETVMQRGGADFITGRFESSLNAGVFLKSPGTIIVDGAPTGACPVQLNIDGEYNVIGD